jgi:PAS domain-containing protein
MGDSQYAENVARELTGKFYVKPDVNDNSASHRFAERAQKEWEATVDSLEQVVLLLDHQGNILKSNPAVEKWRLGKRDDVKGIHFHQLFHPECGDPICYMRNCWTMVQNKLIQNQPYMMEKEDRVLERSLLLHFHPISEGSRIPFNKKDVSAVVVVHDLNPWQQQEKSSRRAASELEAIFQALPDKYVRVTADGTILSYKEGASDEDFFISARSVGKHLRDVLPPAFKKQFLETLEEVNKKRSLVVLEYKYECSVGEQVYEARFIPLFSRQVDIINRNVTETKRLLSIAESMDLMSSLGYIFSGIRHEIGNPINAIKMTVSVLKNNIHQFPDERIMEYLDRVLIEINRVEYLLRNLKNFNMFEDLNPEELHLPDFMSQFLSLVEKDFKTKGITVGFHPRPSPGAAQYIQQCLGRAERGGVPHDHGLGGQPGGRHPYHYRRQWPGHTGFPYRGDF